MILGNFLMEVPRLRRTRRRLMMTQIWVRGWRGQNIPSTLNFSPSLTEIPIDDFRCVAARNNFRCQWQCDLFCLCVSLHSPLLYSSYVSGFESAFSLPIPSRPSSLFLSSSLLLSNSFLLHHFKIASQNPKFLSLTFLSDQHFWGKQTLRTATSSTNGEVHRTRLTSASRFPPNPIKHLRTLFLSANALPCKSSQHVADSAFQVSSSLISLLSYSSNALIDSQFLLLPLQSTPLLSPGINPNDINVDEKPWTGANPSTEMQA